MGKCGYEQIFLATDSLEAITLFQKEFGDRLVFYQDVQRSDGNIGVQYSESCFDFRRYNPVFFHLIYNISYIARRILNIFLRGHYHFGLLYPEDFVYYIDIHDMVGFFAMMQFTLEYLSYA